MSMLTPSTSEGDVEAITRIASPTPPQNTDAAPPQPPQEQASQDQSVVSSAQSAQPRKFTSLNVNKRFLEKASPTPSAAVITTQKTGDTNSPRLSSSPASSTRLIPAKLSSVPKAQPVGWATSKAGTPGAPAASDASTGASTDPTPGDASLSATASSPRPANQTAQPPSAASAASAKLVTMGRQSPRPTSAGIEFGSLSGRASPGLKNASLGTLNRSVSPAASVAKAPWASLKSGLSSSGTRPSTMSDFPTAAEAAKAKQDQEDRAAAIAAKEAARQQAALQALDRFRGTSLGSGKHWDEMEDEDGGFLDEVVEFGDGTQYKIPASSEEQKAANPDAPPITKEERFKDVSHDRSWPPRGPQSATSAKATPPSAPAQKISSSTEPSSTPFRASRSEQRADKVIIPTTGASVSLRSPVESREPAGYAYGRERRGLLTPGGRADATPASAASQQVSQAVRAWGPLAQRQVALNPGSAPPVAAASRPAAVASPVPANKTAKSPLRTAASVAAPAVSASAQSTSQTTSVSSEARPSPYSSRPPPPHLAQGVKPAEDSALGRKTSFPDAEGRRPSETASRAVQQPAPSQQPGQPAPWGPRGLAQARLQSEAAQSTVSTSPQAAAAQAPAPAPAPVAEEEDLQSAIERARKRRQEEENVRLAEKERARQKAVALEEKIKAEQAAKEEEARKVAAAKAQAEADEKRKAADAAAAAAAAAAASQLPRKTGPADNATSWRTTRSQSVTLPPQASNDTKERSGDQRAPRTDRSSVEPLPRQRQAPNLSAEKPSSTTTSPPRDQPSAKVSEMLPPSAQEQSIAHSTPADAPRIILSRPAQAAQLPANDATDRSVTRRQPPLDTEKPRRGLAETSERSKGRDTTREQSIVKDTKPTPRPAPVSAPVKLHPVVPQEALQTRQEVQQEAPPAWNRFVVHLAPPQPRQKLTYAQQKYNAARAAALNAGSRPVSFSTWETSLTNATSHNDLLFPKQYTGGVLTAFVSLPTRTLQWGVYDLPPPPESKRARFESMPEQGRGTIFGASAREDPALSTLPASTAKIQVKLPGRASAVSQPAMSSLDHSAHSQSGPAPGSLGDASTDAIISEVMSSSSPHKAGFDSHHRGRDPMQSAHPTGPLDQPHNAFASDPYNFTSNGVSAELQSSGSAVFRAKGRRGSNPGVSFYEERSAADTPSPVSFMASSDVRNDVGGARGSLSPFGITASSRGSQTQTPASGSSVLPSPSLSTQGTWGQSSLTFPLMEPRSSNLAHSDHIKSVWSLAADPQARETQNSLKDIADDFLPSTMPMSVHDFRADDPMLAGTEVGHSSTVNLRQTSPSSHFNRFSQYGRAAREASASGQELSPVAHRSSGFEPSSRSTSQDAGAQQRNSTYGGLNGASGQGYGYNSSSQFASRGADNTLGSYGNYGNGASLTTDSLYGTGYGAGSMTPTNRQGYGQYASQSSTAHSAPGSPYNGVRPSSKLSSSNYSLFANGTSGNGSGMNLQGDSGAGLGVMDESAAAAAFGGRNQFYGGQATRSYQQQRQMGQSGSGNWPSETTPNPPASTLRPAASVFNPQNYSPNQRTAATTKGARGSSTGPIDRTTSSTSSSSTGTFAAPSTSSSSTPYNRFSPSSGLW